MRYRLRFELHFARWTYTDIQKCLVECAERVDIRLLLMQLIEAFMGAFQGVDSFGFDMIEDIYTLMTDASENDKR